MWYASASDVFALISILQISMAKGGFLLLRAAMADGSEYELLDICLTSLSLKY